MTVVSYTNIAARASTLIGTFGVMWTLTRNGVVLGKLAGVRTTVETSYKKTGLVLASDKNVEVLMTNTFTVQPGDSISNGTDTFTVASVAPLQPGSVVIIQRVVAS